jgi:IMP dehydrogenase
MNEANQPLYGYDDVCLIPQYSEIRSRKDPDTSIKLFDTILKTPFISANMDSVTGHRMAVAMWNAGGIGAIHRFMTVAQNIEELNLVQQKGAKCIVSIGVKDYKERVAALYENGARYFVVDIAHGHSILMKETVEYIKGKYSNVFVIAGNVATSQGVYDLSHWGADVIKCGISNGSLCTTRVKTGHGVPMFSCLLDCATMSRSLGIKIIADGGIKNGGDAYKGLVGGGNYLMIGSLLAGTDEASGKRIIVNGEEKVVYRGMASRDSQVEFYGYELNAAEGAATVISKKGPMQNIIADLTANIRSAMSYSNCKRLGDVPFKTKWAIQTQAAYIEGTPHLLSQK